MGKKQKMKKAATAAAKRAQLAKVAGDALISGCDDAGDGGGSNVPVKDQMSRDMLSRYSKLHSLLSLARKLDARASVKCQSPASSVSESTSDGGDSYYEYGGSQIEEGGAVGGAGISEPKLKSESIHEFSVVPKYSRGEKKARRLLMKLDLQPVKNVTRVTMRKAKNVMLFIDNPEVYKCPNTNTYICFGEVRAENPSNAATVQAAERYINDGNNTLYEENVAGESGLAANGNGVFDMEELALALDDKDVELVQAQATCSRHLAIKALLKNNSDVVNAIMDLTLGAVV